MTVARREFLKYTLAAGFATTGLPLAAQSSNPFRIAVLNDQSSVYSAVGGKGSLYAVQMAVEDFGGTLLGRPIEVLSADHQNKVEIATGIAREWIEARGVEAIFDLGNSACALAVIGLLANAQKIAVVSGGVSSEITGKACTPFSFHWVQDTYATSRVQSRALVDMGKKKWFLINPDYAVGNALERDITAALTEFGGTAVGKVKLPIGSSDFSAAIVTAANSGADVVQIGQTGPDLTNFVKQVKEYGLDSTASVSVTSTNIVDIINTGLGVMRGLFVSEPFYWDQNDEVRAWSKRYIDKIGIPPNALQAGNYSGTLHYLKAVAAAGSTDGTQIAKAIRARPVSDMMSKNLVVREDGRVIRGMIQFRVKSPEESKYKFDIFEILAEIPGTEVVRPFSQSECPMIKR